VVVGDVEVEVEVDGAVLCVPVAVVLVGEAAAPAMPAAAPPAATAPATIVAPSSLEMFTWWILSGVGD